MKWKTYLMGAAAAERMEARGMSAHLSHAVEVLANNALRPLCSVKVTSLCLDDSLTKDGELPDCPACKRAIERAAKHGKAHDKPVAFSKGRWDSLKKNIA